MERSLRGFALEERLDMRWNILRIINGMRVNLTNSHSPETSNIKATCRICRAVLMFIYSEIKFLDFED
jgi:hypothetical protein